MNLTDSENVIINAILNRSRSNKPLDRDFLRLKLREHTKVAIPRIYNAGFKDGEQCGYLEAENDDKVFLDINGK